MSTKTITKADYTEAVYSKQIILPAIAALKAVDSRALAGNSYSAKKISQAVSVLEMHLKDCEKLFAQVEADWQAAGGTELLGIVARRIAAISGEISLNERTAEHLRQGHDYRVSELKHSGFSEKQIATIEPYPAQELADHAATVEALKAEQEKLHAFVASAPVYEMHHLNTTQFEDGLRKAEIA
ncbi:hypothetical protein [Methylomonas albis]|uniref:Uncharacterized protein n=1 Tax=Methylomonas albis TaxID=1854563 RepID=A0ABR9D138_9GAMM|nr:hypothetical protein [Methylomonas albis]MBD9356807.1 hypothetical protein [Methylomonas albis]CAD6879961.1 hypothetical protein [Methylomonas albis]